MKRRDFLAFIPTISAIPFVATGIQESKGKIEIINPTPKIINPNAFSGLDMSKCRLILEQDGIQIGSGYLTEISIDRPLIETSVRDSDGFYEQIAGAMTVSISGVLNNLIAYT